MFVWPSDNFSRIFGKNSEIIGKSSKTSSLVCLYNKHNITCPLVDTNFSFECSTRYLTGELSEPVRYRVEQFNREVTRWHRKWLSVEEDIPQTLVETLDPFYPEFYPGSYVAIKTLLTCPVSTCAAERSSSSMRRLKMPLRSVMADTRLSSLSDP